MSKRVVMFFFLAVLLSGCRKEFSKYIKKNAEHSVTVTKDLIWASPGEVDLTMDIYVPNTGKESYPVVIFFHGGGWLINTKEDTEDAASYLATQSEFIVCNVNYRLLGDAGNTIMMNQIIEDAFGAVLWVKSNIADYGGDSEEIILTGDSAGGHLALMVCTQPHKIGSGEFGPGNFVFNPTWLPEGQTAEDILAADGMAVQGAVIHYGAVSFYNFAVDNFETESFTWQMAEIEPRGFFGPTISVEENPDYYRAVSPLESIPDTSEFTIPPMLFTVGTKDKSTTPQSIQFYMMQLAIAGHGGMEYWENQGRRHAYVSNGKSIVHNFKKDGIPALDRSIIFLNENFGE